METLAFALLAAAILLYGGFSRVLQNRSVTAPMAFAALGLLMSDAVFGALDASVPERVIELVTELTLVLVLFADAARVRVSALMREGSIPARMLLIGLPLAVALGGLAAHALFPQLGWAEAMLLGAVLAPTDAALGQAVITDDAVPAQVRQTVNVESGLNDGLALPMVFILLAFVAPDEASRGAWGWAGFAGQQIVFGAAAGLLAGGLGGKWVEVAVARGWMTEGFEKLSAVGLALIAFAAAELIGGNSFIAAFAAGLALGAFAGRVCEAVADFGETEGQLLSLITFAIFGFALLPGALAALDWRIAVFAALSLIAIRPLAIWLSLAGVRLHLSTKLFLGWFGPRGLASIVFAVIVAGRTDFAAQDLILNVAAITVALSILAHGLSARPLARLYVGRISGLKADSPEMREFEEIEPSPARFRMDKG